MFPDCPAQPANILRARYTFPGQREKPPQGPLLTLAAEELLQPVPGDPQARDSYPVGPTAPRSLGLRKKAKRRFPSPFGERLENMQ